MTPAIAAIDLVKRYPGGTAPALDGLTFSVPPGQAVGLLGPAGAGKTTLLKLVGGASRASSGRILVYGRQPDAATRRDVAVVHQSVPFDLTLTVRDNLRIAAGFRGLPWRRARPRADELLGAFELAGSEDRPVHTLAAGQRRRLQLVRALLRVPRVLLLDDPSAGLDAEGRRRVWACLDELRRQHEPTIVLTSHHLDEVERNTERVLVLRHGRLVRDGAPAQLRDERGEVRAVLRSGSVDGWPAIAAGALRRGLAAARGGDEIVLTGPDLRRQLARLLAELADQEIRVDSVELVTAALEEASVFLTRGPGARGPGEGAGRGSEVTSR
ncbi:ABC transporter ATP-binding protein [Micromonospora sp. WMMD1102]|uniref:ABC transporter ATP-binding protein n=1 Tax=Micromonospora sp. WMMD1102 TaxID=3016105 RepID=UPI002414F5BF|nr:ABC transporter ATP-binding protein [Micromonospora sp. WMMD1102]MDG4791481.1 ABC transporter ATP-binding protein [Micromonospora sp. WMMD1102]